MTSFIAALWSWKAASFEHSPWFSVSRNDRHILKKRPWKCHSLNFDGRMWGNARALVLCLATVGLTHGCGLEVSERCYGGKIPASESWLAVGWPAALPLACLVPYCRYLSLCQDCKMEAEAILQRSLCCLCLCLSVTVFIHFIVLTWFYRCAKRLMTRMELWTFEW